MEMFWTVFCALKQERLFSLSFVIIESMYVVLQVWGDFSLCLKLSFSPKLLTTVTCGKHTYELWRSILCSFERCLKCCSWCSQQSTKQCCRCFSQRTGCDHFFPAEEQFLKWKCHWREQECKSFTCVNNLLQHHLFWFGFFLTYDPCARNNSFTVCIKKLNLQR